MIRLFQIRILLIFSIADVIKETPYIIHQKTLYFQTWKNVWAELDFPVKTESS